jgi:hypothetical protein
VAMVLASSLGIVLSFPGADLYHLDGVITKCCGSST